MLFTYFWIFGLSTTLALNHYLKESYTQRCSVSSRYSISEILSIAFKRENGRKTAIFDTMPSTASIVHKIQSELKVNHSHGGSPARNSSRVYSFRSNKTSSTKFKGSDSDDQLKYLASSLLDFDLLNRTIKEWTRPLPSTYMSRPLVLVGIIYLVYYPLSIISSSNAQGHQELVKVVS